MREISKMEIEQISGGLTPAATMANLTATGDVIIATPAVINLVKGLPQATLGSPVAGAMCVPGVITMTTAVTNLAKGIPVANIGSMVTGVSPLGIPVTTAVTVCPAVTNIA